MVFEILETGRQNAKTGRELCDKLHITKRELGRVIESERRAGRPICSTSDSTSAIMITPKVSCICVKR